MAMKNSLLPMSSILRHGCIVKHPRRTQILASLAAAVSTFMLGAMILSPIGAPHAFADCAPPNTRTLAMHAGDASSFMLDAGAAMVGAVGGETVNGASVTLDTGIAMVGTVDAEAGSDTPNSNHGHDCPPDHGDKP